MKLQASKRLNFFWLTQYIAMKNCNTIAMLKDFHMVLQGVPDKINILVLEQGCQFGFNQWLITLKMFFANLLDLV